MSAIRSARTKEISRSEKPCRRTLATLKMQYTVMLYISCYAINMIFQSYVSIDGSKPHQGRETRYNETVFFSIVGSQSLTSVNMYSNACSVPRSWQLADIM